MSVSRPALLAMSLAALTTAPVRSDPWALRAGTVHVGDGSVLGPSLVLVDDGRVTGIREGGAPVPAGHAFREVDVLLPGLIVARHAPPRPGDDRSVDPERLALDLIDLHADRTALLRAGVTAVVVSPGQDRLVTGRGGVLRLTGRPSTRAYLREGALHAVLGPGALAPPDVFEPNVPVNVDHPLVPARSQRPDSPSAAVAELRASLEHAAGGRGHRAFRQVVARSVPLRVHAHREADIAAALGLARDHSVDLVIEGGTEAWKRAAELAELGAAVVLDVPAPWAGRPADPGLGDARPDAAAILLRAGVAVALAAPLDGPTPDPLLAAAAAVRAGLSPAEALAGLTGAAARAAGAPELGRIEVGAPADLVGFDAPPLSARGRPVLTFVAGRLLWERASDERPTLVIRAGTIHAGDHPLRDASVVIRDGVIAGIHAGRATSAGSKLLDFGREAVVVAGLLDPFSAAGRERGAAPPGGPLTDARDAVEADHPSLRRALAAGITAVHAVPQTSGPLRGRSGTLSTAPDGGDDASSDGGPQAEFLRGRRGVVFHLDDGPSDTGARSQRISQLEASLKGAKRYHEQREAWEKRDEEKQKKGDAGSGHDRRRHRDLPGRRPEAAGSTKKTPKEPERKPEQEVLRDLFRGRAGAYLRAGRHDTIRRGLAAFRSVGLTPVLVGAEEADLIADELRKAEVTVILAPGTTRSETGRRVHVAAELRRAGVPVAFGSVDGGESWRLPLAVAGEVRAGLSPADALSAITATAARAMGQADALGRLEAGRRADCVVFSGDPFEPASRVLAVVADGRLVYEWGDDMSGLGS